MGCAELLADATFGKYYDACIEGEAELWSMKAGTITIGLSSCLQRNSLRCVPAVVKDLVCLLLYECRACLSRVHDEWFCRWVPSGS